MIGRRLVYPPIQLLGTWAKTSSNILKRIGSIALDFMGARNRVQEWRDPTIVFLAEKTKNFYPLVMTNIAVENDPVEIMDYPISIMVIFQFANC